MALEQLGGGGGGAGGVGEAEGGGGGGAGQVLAREQVHLHPDDRPCYDRCPIVLGLQLGPKNYDPHDKQKKNWNFVHFCTDK